LQDKYDREFNPEKNFVKPLCLGVFVAGFFLFLNWGMSTAFPDDILPKNPYLTRKASHQMPRL